MIKVKMLKRIAEIEKRKNPSFRLGQALFNFTSRVYPDIAEKIFGTKNDCFYDDNKITRFCVEFIYQQNKEQAKTMVMPHREALIMIKDLAYDYDGCNTVEDLKELIDEFIDIAKKSLDNY